MILRLPNFIDLCVNNASAPSETIKTDEPNLSSPNQDQGLLQGDSDSVNRIDEAILAQLTE